MLTSETLSQLDWLDHGFGTRHSAWNQDRMASLTQIHSALVLKAATSGIAGEADALITNTPGLAISIRTADCFPMLFADPEHHAVAAIHAGWRGTAAGIVSRTIDTMGSEFGTSPDRIAVAIGPGIGACCYEVGGEVARQFGSFGLESARYLDLAAVNGEQLVRAGVLASRIDTLRRCTHCESGVFHSYRRDKEAAGRMISFIRLRDKPGLRTS